MSAADTPAEGTSAMTLQVKYIYNLAVQMFVHMKQTITTAACQDMQTASSHMLLHLDLNTKPCAR